MGKVVDLISTVLTATFPFGRENVKIMNYFRHLQEESNYIEQLFNPSYTPIEEQLTIIDNLKGQTIIEDFDYRELWHEKTK